MNFLSGKKRNSSGSGSGNGSISSSAKRTSLNSSPSITGTINKISYCAFSVILHDEDGNNTKKVVYVQKFPPAGGTKIPDLSTESTSEELKVDPETKATLTTFWSSNEDRQVNGNWKGGAWGTGNLLTTDPAWCTGGFIGDTVTITIVKQGIIKFNGGKPLTGDIIPGTEDQALSCTVDILGKSFGGYVTDNIMPQKANDVLFIYKNSEGKKFIKMLKRGVGPNVDMPARMMPGAGEHLEPGKDVKLKAGVLRAVQEEIGIPVSTLSNCYLINLGVFEDDGRDPRYWMYSAEQDGSIIEFGMKRGSSSQAFVIYYESESGAEPAEGNPLDTEEVNKKWWHPFTADILELPEKDWMIIDHKKIVERALPALEEFDGLSQAEKDTKKMAVSGGGRRRKGRKTQKKVGKKSKQSKKSKRHNH